MSKGKYEYDEDFYELMRRGSRSSGRVVVPLLKDLVAPKSVLDVGCGVGTWAGVWLASGVEDVLGVDGDYVNTSLLDIPKEKFHVGDLTKPLDLGRRFDLATCFEVAEHIPEASAETLVQTLVKHSDVIAFSAAVPRQGGANHINLQWPSYWAKIFSKFGYRAFDPLRAVIWDNENVEWWYRQNALLFVAETNPLAVNLTPPTGPIDIVHPALLETWARPAEKFLALRGKFISSAPGRTMRSIRDSFAQR
jgi:SAM-dependent methyltransferase